MTDEEKINWVHCLLQEVWNRNIPTQEEIETALGLLEEVRENVS